MSSASANASAKPAALDNEDPESYINLVVHNVIFQTSSAAQMKVKWMRARMYPTKANTPASFDDLNSFRLQITEGLMGMNVNDLSALLRRGVLKNSPVKNLQISASGEQLKISGTLRKVIPLPVQMLADVSASPDHRHVRFHTTKINVLKIPFKRLLGAFHLHTSDFFSGKGMRGIVVQDDNVDIDVSQLLPPPATQGYLSEVKVWKTGELMQYYGEPREDAISVKEWRNFMRMRGGTLSFGKLTMHHTDLLLVDKSQADWLNFDVNHYQEQLVNGDAHITPSAGLQIFIPDINKIPPSKRNREIGLQWMKNRNMTPPADVP